jgi:hypothetical protein
MCAPERIETPMASASSWMAGLDHLLGGLVEAGVDDLHPGVAQGAGDDLGAPVVAVEPDLRHHHPDRAFHTPHSNGSGMPRQRRAPDARSTIPCGDRSRGEEGDAGEEEEHPAEQADHVPGPDAGRHKERRGDDEEHPSQEVVPLVPVRAVFGHANLLS